MIINEKKLKRKKDFCYKLTSFNRYNKVERFLVLLRSRMKGTRAHFTARKADSQPSEYVKRRFDRMGLNHEGKTAIICCDRSHKAGSPGTYVRIRLSKNFGAK